MFNSKTNNTIYYSNINKQQQFMTLSTRNKQVNDVNCNGNGNSSNTRNKKVNSNSKSVFDFDLLRKYITISQSKSKSKPKHNNNNSDNKKNNKERYKLNSGIINSNNNILLPINNKIPSIKIKGINKLLEYPLSYHTIRTHNTPTSKLSNINRKIKYNK